MFVKICGITDVETALFAAECGADAIGMVFAHSKRRVSLEKAREISKSLPKSVWKIGVFVNEDPVTIRKIVKEAELDFVQLHGEETPEYARSLDVPVIKAFGLSKETNQREMAEYPARYLLLDSPKGTYYGGNGKTFDWSLVEEKQLKKEKIIIAGGLNPENVQLAIEAIQPFGVDVSSGVETDGRKDRQKIKLFIDNAKGVQK
jgi:phosphoribosylanthranilate isomerase